MRKRCMRRKVVPMPPQGLRRPLAACQLRELGLVHNQHLDAMKKNEAGEAILWNWVSAVLTWSRAAELLQAGVPEMAQQLELAAQLVERYGLTGQVALQGTDYALAKEGVGVMDQLAELVDQPTATAAALWSQRRIKELQAGKRRPEGMTA
jgi:hypothetical protein